MRLALSRTCPASCCCCSAVLRTRRRLLSRTMYSFTRCRWTSSMSSCAARAEQGWEPAPRGAHTLPMGAGSPGAGSSGRTDARAKECIHVCACAAGGCVHRPVSCVPRLHGCQDQPPAPRLTSRKHSCSSENSGSLASTVEATSSRVCAEAAQRVCVSLLNSGCAGRKAGCLARPAGAGCQPPTRNHAH